MPFWAAAATLDLPLSLHTATQGQVIVLPLAAPILRPLALAGSVAL
jgi:predicted TIM-barrel fold metal-dependent hydrolase